MPIETQPEPAAAFICAITARDPALLNTAIDKLVDQFGTVEQPGSVYPFDYSDYYAEEMGEGLIKQLLWFGEIVQPSSLFRAKQKTVDLERDLATVEGEQVARRVNIDPGLVTVESLVLATTKYSGHRICIGAKLYAEITLLFERGEYRPMPWTYMDYKSEPVQEFLLEVRGGLLKERRDR